jgi:hypothetical protein
MVGIPVAGEAAAPAGPKDWMYIKGFNLLFLSWVFCFGSGISPHAFIICQDLVIMHQKSGWLLTKWRILVMMSTV